MSKQYCSVVKIIDVHMFPYGNVAGYKACSRAGTTVSKHHRAVTVKY